MNINDEHESEEPLKIVGVMWENWGITWTILILIGEPSVWYASAENKASNRNEGFLAQRGAPLLSQLGFELGWLGFIVILAIVRWSYNPTHRPSHYKYSLQEPISYLWVYGRHTHTYIYISIYIFIYIYTQSYIPYIVRWVMKLSHDGRVLGWRWQKKWRLHSCLFTRRVRICTGGRPFENGGFNGKTIGKPWETHRKMEV